MVVAVVVAVVVAFALAPTPPPTHLPTYHHYIAAESRVVVGVPDATRRFLFA